MHILLTGGGTGGHIVPNLALVDALRERGDQHQFSYIGSRKGLEAELVPQKGIHFEWVATGKMRRYFSWENAWDFMKIPVGIVQAWWKLGRLKPDVVFSKGGYVAFPVVMAAWLRRIPLVAHESDAVPGLSTKLSARFASRILLAYERAKIGLAKHESKLELVGNPVHPRLFKGSAGKAKTRFGLKGEKPVLVILGGSTGSQEINDWMLREQEELLRHFEVLHLTGEGKGVAENVPGYVSLPFVSEGMEDLYALASLALTRAGAGTLAELEALQIPALLLPLGLKASRGDQLFNAQEMTKRCPFMALAEPEKPLVPQLLALPKRGEERKATLALDRIIEVLEDLADSA